MLIDVEHGKRGILYERLIDIADALDVPVRDLFTEAEAADADAGTPHHDAGKRR